MSTAKVKDRINADRRLTVLRLLTEYRGSLNSSSLESALRVYHPYIDRPMVRDDLHWLELRSLVRLDDIGRGVSEVRVTPDGELVATGDKWVEGVARPSGD